MGTTRSPRASSRRRRESASSELRTAELHIERLAAGGDGVGHMPDGRVIFVPLCAPGDRVRVRVSEVRRRFLRGELIAVLEAGPGRIEPECQHFGECGGCAWQHLDYRVQLEAKGQIVRDALERIAGWQRLPEIRTTASPRSFHYRQRARVLTTDDGGVGYRARHSHRLCAVHCCPVLVEPLERTLCGLANTTPFSGDHDSPTGRNLAERELICGARGPAVRELPVPAAAGGRFRGASSTAGSDADASHGVDSKVEFGVLGHSFSVSAGGFVQGNALLFDALAEAVVRAAIADPPAAEAEKRGVLLELFAGCGYLTLPLASRFARTVAVESNPIALRDLADNLAHSGEATAVEIEAGDVSDVLPRLMGLQPDVVVLDPPRTGLGASAAATLCQLRPARIVYLSCDPATLARDAAVCSRAGYRARSVELFDLFPQTPHVETLMTLELDETVAQSVAD